MAKPGEMIDFTVKGIDRLTSDDLWIENVLLANAMQDEDLLYGAEPEFTIEMSEVRGTHKDATRVKESMTRLQQTVMQMRTAKGSILTSVQKLGSFEHDTKSGVITYTYAPTYFRVLQDSKFWGIIDLDVQKRMRSKYGRRLYETVCRRLRMQGKQSERFDMRSMRKMVLGVPDGKQEMASALWRHAIVPAVEAVNLNACDCTFSPFSVGVTPYKEGRKITGYDVHWAECEVIEAVSTTAA